MVVNKNKITAQAQKFTARGQFEKAILEYRKILKSDANDIRTWLKMGDLYTRMGARKEATETYLKVAEYYRNSDFHLKAVAVYKQVLKLDPTLLDVYEMLADAYLSLGLSSDALIQLEQLADMFQRTDHPDRMLRVLMRMGEIDPQNISTRLRIAEQHSKDGKTKEAVKHFSAACDQLLEQGRTDDYIKVAERLLYHDSSLIDIAREVAALYLEIGKPKRALTKLQMCFSKDPRNIRTLTLLAEAFHGLKQPDKAISVYTEIANLLEEQNQPEERKKILRKVLELDPNNKMASKEVPKAEHVSEKKAEANDGLPSPAEAMTGTIAGAAKAVNEPEILVEENAAEKAEKLLSEAEVLLKYGLVDRAKDHINNIFEIDYYNLNARERLKEVHLEAGNWQDAVEQLFILAEGFIEEQPEGTVFFLHQVLKIDPDNLRARKMITDIGGVMPEELLEAEADDKVAPGDELTLDEKLSSPEPTEQPEVALSIDDIPYVSGSNEFSELDLHGEGWPEEEDTDILDLGDADIISEPDMDADLIPVSDTLDVEEPQMPEDDPAHPPRRAAMQPPRAPTPPPRAPTPPPRAATPPSRAPTPPSRKAGVPGPTLPSRPPMKPKVARPLAKEPSEVTESVEDLSDISESLEEIDFFISQGLEEEAEGILVVLLEEHPNDKRVLKLAAEIRGGDQEDGSEPASETPFDLDALAEDLGFEEATNDDVFNEIDEVFSQFKAGVEKQISQSDYATHYDLGVAYKEMGLFEDAISEFKIATGDPARVASSEMMTGICLVGLGRYDDAIGIYTESLEKPGLDEGERMAIMYELGIAHEAHGNKSAALELFNKILNKDPGFADVVDRIDGLE